MFDLDTWVDLNEIVTVLLIDQEFSSTGVLIPTVARKFEGIGEDGLAYCVLYIKCEVAVSQCRE